MNPLIKISGSLLLAAGTIFTASAAPHQPVSEVNLNIDGMEASYLTQQPTVGDFLKERGILLDQEDMVNFPDDMNLSKASKVVVSRAVPIRIKADGQELEINTLYPDVASVLSAENIHLGDLDTINVALTSEVEKDMEIIIQRVTVKETTETVPVDFKVKRVKTKDLLKDKEKIQTSGEAGSRSIVTRQIFVDGELTATTEAEAVTKAPVDKEILVGTRVPVKKVKAEEKKKPAVSTKKVEAKKPAAKKTSSKSNANWKTFKLSFYTNLPSENGGWTITASGKKLKYGMAASNYYSIGKKIHLEGWGEFTIEDRGGSNFNNSTRLDIFIPRKSGESNSAYLKRVNMMGLKSVKGYVK